MQPNMIGGSRREQKAEDGSVGGRPRLNHQLILLPLLWLAQNPTVSCQLEIRYYVSNNQFLSPSIYYYFYSLKKKVNLKILSVTLSSGSHNCFCNKRPHQLGSSEAYRPSRFRHAPWEKQSPFPVSSDPLIHARKGKQRRGSSQFSPTRRTPSRPTLLMSYAFLSLLSFVTNARCELG